MGIVKTIGLPESFTLLHHRLLGCWPGYRVEAHRGASRGVIHDLTLIYSVAAATLGFEFCLVLVFH
jgi:hypothetical protein